MSLDLVDKSGSAPTYYTYQGVYLDEKDAVDGESYIYLSFTMGSSYDIHIMRIYNPSSPRIDWHRKYIRVGSITKNTARHIFMDSADNTQFYWLGKYDDSGAVIKFQKSTGSLMWQVQFYNDVYTSTTTNGTTTIAKTSTSINLEEISSYVQAVGQSHFVACGY